MAAGVQKRCGGGRKPAARAAAVHFPKKTHAAEPAVSSMGYVLANLDPKKPKQA